MVLGRPFYRVLIVTQVNIMMDANLVLQIAAATARKQLPLDGGISELAPEILTRLGSEWHVSRSAVGVFFVFLLVVVNKTPPGKAGCFLFVVVCFVSLFK